MYETTIQLNAINDVKDFVNKVMLFNYDIDLVSGRYAIDAKSIMGIFSLDLSKPIKLQAQACGLPAQHKARPSGALSGGA